MRLFNVTTKVKEFKGCKDVLLWWFHEGVDGSVAALRGEIPPPRIKRPYAELIENYDANPLAHYNEMIYIDECFTEEEATQLKNCLDRGDDRDVTTITEVEFPLPQYIMDFDHVMGNDGYLGGSVDYKMVLRPDYACFFPATHARVRSRTLFPSADQLPFPVVAYFNLIGCELIDGSGVYRRKTADVVYLAAPAGRHSSVP